MHLAAEVDVAGLGHKTKCQITLLANHRPPSSMDVLEVCHVVEARRIRNAIAVPVDVSAYEHRPAHTSFSHLSIGKCRMP
ncbi:hypothetical protein WCN79_09210 [Xanthomonas axonopodis pv. vasculorum]|uniref:hypothetical protein n=1 Tax=Xanthomonas axonopodis TaxID=53413 RepID=UPI00143165C8|nr:hypothetical protein [Xanthomonas axonopodis]QKD85168.1 hypothetical protein XAV_14040 [Xanthomonas axonopodis pv. vasculorum]